MEDKLGIPYEEFKKNQEAFTKKYLETLERNEKIVEAYNKKLAEQARKEARSKPTLINFIKDMLGIK